MNKISTIGLDLAKSVLQVHGIDTQGRVVVRRQLRRKEVLSFFAELPPCLVGMEACATAHYWGRELIKLGHTVKLMPPAYVKPYVKRGKTDAADAEAITEAVTRPTMRFVAVKSMDQQAILMLHRVRDLLVRQRTMLINALRGHLAEFGIVTARGPAGVKAAIVELHATQDSLPPLAKMAFHQLIDRLESVGEEIRKMEREIVTWCRHNDASRRLATIPGIGPITAITDRDPIRGLHQGQRPSRRINRPDTWLHPTAQHQKPKTLLRERGQWYGPRPRGEGISSVNCDEGGCHAGRSNRSGSCEVCVRGSRRRQPRKSRRAKDAAPRCGSPLLRQSAAMSDRHGSVERSALFGKGAFRFRP